MSSRGGMCSNPFGGEERIDRINLLDYLGSNAPSEKTLYSCVIQDAASNYLYALLGKNGTSVQEFFASYQYFFKITSDNKDSWGSRKVKKIYSKRGQKISETHILSDTEMEMMCFDKHYDLSGLSVHLHIDKFRSQLLSKRRRIVTNNWEQISAYINQLYEKELSEISVGCQVPMPIWHDDLMEVLINPTDPILLASAVYVPSRLKKSKGSRSKKSSLGKFSELAQRISSKECYPLQDWGPLSSLMEGND